MNIHRINPLGDISCNTPSRVEKDQGFNEIFERRLSETTPGGDVPGGTTRPEAALLDRSDRILERLETLAADLANPSKTLKDMDPLVAEIDREVRQLEMDAAAETAPDPALGDILRDLKITAQVAVFKYQRGDFIA